MIKTLSLSLVIPAYNEERRITACLEEVQNFIKTFPHTVEVILAIEKSSDNTLNLAREIVGQDPRFRILSNDVQKGKGYAVKTGMLQAIGDIVIFMDADLSTPLKEIIQFIDYYQAHPEVDLIIGSRQHAKSRIIKKQHPLRQKMGQIFNLFVQKLAIKGISDTQCGFKSFRQHTVQPLFQRQTLHGFSFDVEILLLARELNYQIEVLPVEWLNNPDSKVHIVRDSLRMFIDLLRIKKIVRKTLRDKPHIPAPFLKDS